MRVQRLADAGTTLAVGETFLVSIEASNLKAFHTAQVEVVYDPTRLRVIGGPLGVDRGTLFVHNTTSSDQKMLGWLPPKQWVDLSKPLARIVISGDRAQVAQVEIISGTIAVLRMQAVAAGTSDIHLDKLVLRDQFGQDLQVSSESLAIRIAP